MWNYEIVANKLSDSSTLDEIKAKCKNYLLGVGFKENEMDFKPAYSRLFTNVMYELHERHEKLCAK